MAQVFLGGSCNPTTWRQDVAIPMLEKAGVTFYNPQVDKWHSSLVALEAQAKKDADVLLFVVDGQTRATASMIEIVGQVGKERTVVACFSDIPDGMEISGETVTGRQLKDLNNARKYCKDEATTTANYVGDLNGEDPEMYFVATPHIEAAVQKCIELIRELEEAPF